MPVLAACGRSSGSSGLPTVRNLWASRLSLGDITPIVGDSQNWWPGAPTFDVPPLNNATRGDVDVAGLVTRFAHVGTGELLEVHYQVFADSAIATNVESNEEAAHGTSLTGPSAGDKSLYYEEKLQVGAAPFNNLAYVRVGQTVIVIVWSHIEGYAGTSTFGKIAVKVASRLKDTLSGKIRPPSPAAVDRLLVAPTTEALVELGGTRLPLETLPDILGVPDPNGLMKDFKNLGATDLVYGDYTLAIDTRMEVQTAGIAFGSSGTGGQDWIAGFFKGLLSPTGEFGQYLPGAGIYIYAFGVGPRAVVMVCKSSNPGEEAGRSCEQSMPIVVAAWHPLLTPGPGA